ncbi:pyridine nucleotide-disulfide oxidoreductase [Aureococcus anophagefferens]|nr:pyridine nucleotide-disulfide oxidoreductase [Aureococcus anophagefferens]
MVPKLLSLLSGAAAFAPAARRWARLLDEDFDGAAREGAAALEVLPDLADVARLRPRCSTASTESSGGDPPRAAFEPAYEAFRLAAVMNPGDSAEARDELARIKELCAQLDGDAAETTPRPSDAASRGSFREMSGARRPAATDARRRWRTKRSASPSARALCNTGRTADGWESGAAAKLYHREADWPEGEVVPYQVRLDDGTLIYAPLDVDGCVRLRPSDGLDADAARRALASGAARRGADARVRPRPARVRLVDRGDAVGASFRAWPAEMRFISPLNQQGWTNSFDLNAVAQDTSPAYALHTQHPSGAEYARYLEALVAEAALDVGTDAVALPTARRRRLRRRTRRRGGIDETIRARFVVWAAGEFQYPREGPCPGRSTASTTRGSLVGDLEGDERRGARGGFDVVAAWREAEAPLAAGRSTAAGRRAGAPGDELVVHTAHPPVLRDGFEGAGTCPASPRVPRGIVADAICRGLGRETKTAVAGLRQATWPTCPAASHGGVR